jgi:4'-phosphopantetheinyl transferase
VNPSIKHLDWHSYHGHALFLEGESHIFKIDAELYFDKIDQDFLLTLDEQQKAVRFRLAADKKNYVVGKHVLKLIVAGFLHIEPGELKFNKAANGKPKVHGINFNIAHTSKYVFIAISSADIGIDVEYVNPSFKYTNVLNNCFSKDEIESVIESDTPLRHFYLLWTRKEALIKATGEGINNTFKHIPSLISKVHRNNTDFNIISFNDDSRLVVSLAFAADTDRFNYWEYQV